MPGKPKKALLVCRFVAASPSLRRCSGRPPLYVETPSPTINARTSKCVSLRVPIPLPRAFAFAFACTGCRVAVASRRRAAESASPSMLAAAG